MTFPEQQQARIDRHQDDRHQRGGVARRCLGGCCERQHQDDPCRLLQTHHRPEVASECECDGEKRRVTWIAPPATVGLPASSVCSAEFHEGRCVAPDDRDRRPERYDYRHQQRSPNQHRPRPRRPDAAQRRDPVPHIRRSLAVGPHHRRPHGKFECHPGLMLNQDSRLSAPAPRLVIDPDRHARLKVGRLSLRIEAQPKRIAVMIADHPLGLPGGEDSERPQFGDDGFDRAIGAVPDHALLFFRS